MIDKIASVILAIVGIINLIPAAVFFDPSKTARFYGVPIAGTDLTILMRHRGVLLGLVGIALIVAAIKTEYRLFAISLALISKLTFIFLTFTATDHNAEIRQVAMIDIGAIVMLLVVLGIHFYSRSI